MSRASEEALAALHGAMAEHFTARLQSGEPMKAADLGVMRQFLKDNHIEAIIGGGDADSSLKKMVDTLGKLSQEELRAH